ncbi:MAG: hypothetical protein ACR2HR_07190 [Euzebya sp.]
MNTTRKTDMINEPSGVSVEQTADRYVPGAPPRVTAAGLRELVADDAWLETVIDQATDGGVSLTGDGGFLPGR